jgi:hypothetical protein
MLALAQLADLGEEKVVFVLEVADGLLEFGDLLVEDLFGHVQGGLELLFIS